MAASLPFLCQSRCFCALARLHKKKSAKTVDQSEEEHSRDGEE